MRTWLRTAALLLVCLSGVSCLNEPTLYMENIWEFATAYEGKLVTDAALTLSVVENESDIPDWNQDGQRYLVNYDILNAQLEVRIRDLKASGICEPRTGASPETLGPDPALPTGQAFSGGFLNLVLKVYKAKEGTDAPLLSCRYEDQPDQGTMFLVLGCDTHGENPVNKDADQLETESVCCSIPLTTLLKGITRNINLVYPKVVTADDGTASIVADTLRQVGSVPIGF